jgi:rhodanese-related sulfurtransferase
MCLQIPFEKTRFPFHGAGFSFSGYFSCRARPLMARLLLISSGHKARRIFNGAPRHFSNVFWRKFMRIPKILLATLFLAATPAFLQAQQAAPAGQQPAPAYQPPPWNYKTPQLKRAQIDALLAKPGEVVVIDLRRPDELISKGSFPAFLSIQLKELENNLGYIPKDRTIITVSNRAHRAGAAGDILSAKGFRVAGAAGTLDYEDEGGTIARITPPTPQPQPTAARQTPPTKQ